MLRTVVASCRAACGRTRTATIQFDQEVKMRIYLVQHGEAKSKNVDPERHLTDNGVRDVEKVADFISPLALRVKAVWHSGKTRAAQTAEILGSAVAAADGVVERSGLVPNDPISPVAEELNKREEDIMLVSHLPFLETLASVLVGASESADVVAFKQGGIVCLERDGEGSWRVAWMLIPELLS